MFNPKFLVVALAGTAMAAMPAQAQLLGGSGGLGGMVSGTLGNGSVVGSVTGSVNKTLDVTVERSVNPRSGHAGANAGLAGSMM